MFDVTVDVVVVVVVVVVVGVSEAVEDSVCLSTLSSCDVASYTEVEMSCKTVSIGKLHSFEKYQCNVLHAKDGRWGCLRHKTLDWMTEVSVTCFNFNQMEVVLHNLKVLS